MYVKKSNCKSRTLYIKVSSGLSEFLLSEIEKPSRFNLFLANGFHIPLTIPLTKGITLLLVE